MSMEELHPIWRMGRQNNKTKRRQSLPTDFLTFAFHLSKSHDAPVSISAPACPFLSSPGPPRLTWQWWHVQAQPFLGLGQILAGFYNGQDSQSIPHPPTHGIISLPKGPVYTVLGISNEACVLFALQYFLLSSRHVGNFMKLDFSLVSLLVPLLPDETRSVHRNLTLKT